MIYVSFLVLCILFVEIFWLLGVMANAREIISCSKSALATISSPNLDDRQKETAARENSHTILKQSFLVLVKLAIISVALASSVFAFIQFNWVSQKEFVQTAFSLPTFASLTIFTAIYAKVRYARR